MIYTDHKFREYVREEEVNILNIRQRNIWFQKDSRGDVRTENKLIVTEAQLKLGIN